MTETRKAQLEAAIAILTALAAVGRYLLVRQETGNQEHLDWGAIERFLAGQAP